MSKEAAATRCLLAARWNGVLEREGAEEECVAIGSYAFDLALQLTRQRSFAPTLHTLPQARPAPRT